MALTPEEQEKVDRLRNKWIGIGVDTEPADRPRAEAGIKEAYKAAGEEPTDNFFWVDDPWEACQVAARWEKYKSFTEGEVTKDEAKKQLANACYGQNEYWLAYYEYFEEEVPEVEKLHGLMEVAKAAHWYWPFEDACIFCERPLEIHLDENERLHNPDGPALLYRSDFKIYSWHGIDVAEHVIERPEEITLEEIDTEQNAEIKRILMERFGHERYLEESGAEVVSEDEFGTLLRKEIPGDEPLTMVKVLNSTPEVDGTSKYYYLRVPPDTKTPHEGVAWTFGLDPETYKPLVET